MSVGRNFSKSERGFSVNWKVPKYLAVSSPHFVIKSEENNLEKLDYAEVLRFEDEEDALLAYQAVEGLDLLVCLGQIGLFNVETNKNPVIGQVVYRTNIPIHNTELVRFRRAIPTDYLDECVEYEPFDKETMEATWADTEGRIHRY